LVGEPGQGLLFLRFGFQLGAFGEDVGEESRQGLEVSEWILTPQAKECARDVVQFSFEDGLQELACLPGDLVWCSFFSGHSSPLFITAQTYSVFADYHTCFRETGSDGAKPPQPITDMLFAPVTGWLGLGRGSLSSHLLRGATVASRQDDIACYVPCWFSAKLRPLLRPTFALDASYAGIPFLLA